MARGLVACTVLSLWLVSATACNGSGMRSVRNEPTAQWPFKPRSIRVHPLTRLQVQDQGALLEVWVQLRDRDGHPVRGPGHLYLTLESAGPGDMHHLTWETHLESPGAGVASRFDPVTYAYFVPLDLTVDTLPPQARLRAVLQTPDGDRFAAQGPVEQPQSD